MSAFVCCDEHISAIVGWYGTVGQRACHRGPLSRTEIIALGQQLLDENYRSVNYRYSEEKPARIFELKREFVTSPVSVVEVIKACHCLEYQSCETEDWRETEAHTVLWRIVKTACRSLPGYDDAAGWEITRHPQQRGTP